MVKAQSQKKSCDISTTLAATDDLQPPKPKFLSLSLPNSANSSPSTLKKKNLKHRSIESPCQTSTLTHQYYQLQEILLQLRRSKSCGDQGRTSSCALPSDEFDLWWAKPSAVESHNMHHENEAIKEGLVNGKDVETCEDDEGFKCSAVCIYLPGFGKAKGVKTKKEGGGGASAISRTVSSEKFECGYSWGSSSALFHEIEGDPMNSSYFDLPLELIKCNANE